MHNICYTYNTVLKILNSLSLSVNNITQFSRTSIVTKFVICPHTQKIWDWKSELFVFFVAIKIPKSRLIFERMTLREI